MSFIRDRRCEKTGYQNGAEISDRIDNGCDFVMVYRFDQSTLERIKQYKERGYVIHFMTGISWGAYQDYLYGRYDGEDHWDEAQKDRFGNIILHSPDIPYMVPTVSFANYITEALKKAVDAGVEAIHVEEPEFWDRAGYSEAFKREYKMYYKKEWTAPHLSVDARYKCAKLKQYLYTRTIDRVSSSIKEYSLKKYGKAVRFYIPTHSILNYTQWKIISPEGKLADIPCVDGCIAQVWTGTSREKNWFNGNYAERTFETAFLEYGVMQELVKNTGRRMWFLHDPIEDNPIFDWNDYKKNYICTVIASLLHPGINDYEICPWPTRVFTGKYPRNSEDATTIPDEYATILNNTFNTLGNISVIKENHFQVGIIMADSQLYQRNYPDSEFSEEAKEEVGTVLVENDELIHSFKKGLIDSHDNNRELMLKFMQSSTFPAFYSLSLPLLKYGTNIRPVLLDNVRRYPGYLDDYQVLIVSYEYLKPDYPDMNLALSEWVKRGGTLIYVGDGADPYNSINSWWTGKYPTPAEHLFEMLGIAPKKEKNIFECQNGIAAVWKINPCVFCYSKENADQLRDFYSEVLQKKNYSTDFKNHLLLERGEYIIASVMDESVSDEPLHLKGNFADMFSQDFSLLNEKIVYPGENCLLCDIDKVTDSPAVIGTSVRINSITEENEKIILNVYGASCFKAYIRLKTDHKISSAEIDGKNCFCEYDKASKTVLVSFESVAGNRVLELIK